MLDVLAQILCWIKQFGAMVLSAIVAGVNLILAGLGGIANTAIDNWPIPMPDLPSMPDAMLTAFGWLRWGPVGIITDGCLALFVLLLTVWVAVALYGPVMRFLKVWD